MVSLGPDEMLASCMRCVNRHLVGEVTTLVEALLKRGASVHAVAHMVSILWDTHNAADLSGIPILRLLARYGLRMNAAVPHMLDGGRYVATETILLRYINSDGGAGLKAPWVDALVMAGADPFLAHRHLYRARLIQREAGAWMPAPPLPLTRSCHRLASRWKTLHPLVCGGYALPPEMLEPILTVAARCGPKASAYLQAYAG